MAKSQLDVCLVGLGWWGRQLLADAEESDLFGVRCTVDPSPESAAFAETKGLTHYTTLDEALAADRLDAVLIATPHSQHEQQCLAALARGKAVFCEKPLTLTEAGARRIVDAVKAQGSVLGIGHERRFEAGFEALAEMISSGRFGRVILIDANISHNLMLRAQAGDWRLNTAEAPAGLWTGTGIHTSDLIIASCGAPSEVRMERLSTSATFSGSELVRVDLRMANGVHATVTTLANTPYYGRYTVFGDKGWAELVNLANVDGGQDAFLTVTAADGTRTTERIAPADTIRANLEQWGRAVLGQGTYRFAPEEIVANTAILEAIVRSTGDPSGFATITTAA